LKTTIKHTTLTNALAAAGVFLLALIVYIKTMQPTLSFWDCGEFIAVSAILGIPHPPGTPLYVLIGHVFTLLPFFADIAVRVNFLSALSSAGAAAFAYLAGQQVLWAVLPDTEGSRYTRFLTHAGAVCGALMLAFAVTQWNNSIEAEVYGLAILIMMVLLWLTILYIEDRGSGRSERLMVLIVYLATLGIGVHMTTFLVLPISALFFIFRRDMSAPGWFLIASAMILELFLIFALSSRPDELPFYLPVLIVFVFYAFYMFSFDQIPRRLLMFAGGFLVALIPLFYTLYRIAVTHETGEVPVVLNGLGLIGLAGLLAYGIISLVQYLQQRNGSGDPERRLLLYPPLFAITAAVLAGVVAVNLHGYHLFLGVSAVVLLSVGWTLRAHLRLTNLIAIAAVSLIIIGVKEFFIGLLAAAVIVPLAGIFLKDAGWKKALLILLAAFMGFMVHLFIPIRSAQEPFINQNNPAQSIQATINFIERKQYGSQSMVERMFNRRAEWENQFGVHERMGFWSIFQGEYGLTGSEFFFLFVLGVFGLWEAVRRRPRSGLLLLLLLMVSSIGLVLYMNFADGTRMTPMGTDYLEVRDRDYFFTPAFVLFGLLIGLGVSALIQFLREMTVNFSSGAKTLILTAVSVLFLLPLYPAARNWWECDRSRNYIPFYYAWNLLQSADPNAVLFTSGDNDTFPLWCAQEAYGIRKDVRVVNLSLANADWYNKQVRDYMKLDLHMTDAQIEGLRVYRAANGTVMRPANTISDAIIKYNYPAVPVNFSVTASPGSRQFQTELINNRLELSGMQFRLTDDTSGLRVNVEDTRKFLTSDSGFRYNGINDSTIYKDEATLRVTRNLASTILMLADTLRKAGDRSGAEQFARMAAEKIPHNTDGANYLASLFAEDGRVGQLADLVQQVSSPDNLEIAVLWARSYRAHDDNDRAGRILDSLQAAYPHSEAVLNEQVRLYVSQQKWPELAEVLQLFLRSNPGHQQAMKTLAAVQQQMRRPDSATGADSPQP
jgi:hypothetical protein